VTHAHAEVEALKLVVTELEEKNRRLSDRLNEIIFNKASVYQQKTIEQLQKCGRQASPLRHREPSTGKKEMSMAKDTQQFRTQDSAYRSRFAQEISRYMYNNNSRSPQKGEDPLNHFNIYRELERFEMSN
jgi:hypothetical protein